MSGTGVTADGRYTFTYTISPISSDQLPNTDFPQCQPVTIDNYKALITLTPNFSVSENSNNNLNNNSAQYITLTAASQQQAPTQSIRRISVLPQTLEQLGAQTISVQQIPTQSIRRISVLPSANEQPQLIGYQTPSHTIRRISVVQQEPSQAWAIASNNSFETVENSNSNIFIQNQ